MNSPYRGFVAPRVYASHTAAAGSIPGTGDVSIMVYEGGQPVEYFRDESGQSTDLIMADNTRWRREAQPDDVLAAAVQAQASAASAVLAAGNAQTAAASVADIADNAADAIRAQVAEDADRAEVAAVGVADTKDKLDRIDQGDALLDDTTRVVALEGHGDLIRVGGAGLQMVVDPMVADQTFETHGVALGPLLADGGRDMIVTEAGSLARVYPDGMAIKLRPDPAEITVENAGHSGILAVDTFDTLRGQSLPTAQVAGATRKAIIISVYGQSNADATEMDDPLIWTAPPMPRHVLMLNDVSGARGGLRGYLGVAAPAATGGLVPARESAVVVGGKYVQSYGTAAAAKLNALAGAPFRMFAVRSSAVGGNKLVGDTAGQGIWQDSTGARTQPWLNWTRDLKGCKDGLESLGYEVEAVHICFTHQESDWQTPRATYASQFAGMKAERDALLATDLPGIPVRWFCDQASGSGLRAGGYEGGAWPSRLAIVDAALAGDMTMVMPRYHMRFGFNGGTREDIHHAHYDRILQGETYAHAMREVMDDREWRCPRALAAAVSGNSVVIDFDSLMPLVLDPTFAKVRDDMGFTVNGGAIAVTDVRLTGQRQVTVTCSAQPVGSIAYAFRTQDAQDVSDEWPISTGALRDAWQAPSLFLPGERLIRAALGFSLPL